MQPDSDHVPRHESVDHEHPTHAGMLSDDPQHVPGTGALGDETLVRATPEGLRLPTVPTPSGHGAAVQPRDADDRGESPAERDEREDPAAPDRHA